MMSEFTEIFAHRVEPESRRDLPSGWTEFRATKSPQTLRKFVGRAQNAGYRSTRIGRGNTVIVRTAELED